MTDQVPKIGFQVPWSKWLWGKLKKGFFFHFFAIFEDFTSWFESKALKRLSNIWQKKYLMLNLLQYQFSAQFWYPKIWLAIHDPSLYTTIYVSIILFLFFFTNFLFFIFFVKRPTYYIQFQNRIYLYGQGHLFVCGTGSIST